jgi:hypothetical protein
MSVLILSLMILSSVAASTTQEVEYYVAANELAERGVIKKKQNNIDYYVMSSVLRQEIAVISRRVS